MKPKVNSPLIFWKASLNLETSDWNSNSNTRRGQPTWHKTTRKKLSQFLAKRPWIQLPITEREFHSTKYTNSQRHCFHFSGRLLLNLKATIHTRFSKHPHFNSTFLCFL
ncbi:hypothetical protein TVAGG3_0542660 [Trichomonas vaginalis G3]|uniref:hypothetical protein n=1 Tax=Trichomonas vaginalis (strain ATCC PRA-98 / G3) TaxID=412133 RepID=UPI0021E57317|nr:hypothetical protein TVAGG3_0542660 [Trichomonas vaginalis G3]KAI5519949.1 hypothetical protein TVAGG3_0542660 [Trichomonas vaginalis G3]